MRTRLTPALRAMVAALGVLVCGLLALSMLLLEHPALLPSAAAYVLLTAAGLLVFLTAAMLRGSRGAWRATCVITIGIVLFPLGRIFFAELPRRDSAESAQLIAITIPGKLSTFLWYFAAYAGTIFLVIGGAFAAIVMLLLPTTRADLRCRAHPPQGPRSSG